MFIIQDYSIAIGFILYLKKSMPVSIRLSIRPVPITAMEKGDIR